MDIAKGILIILLVIAHFYSAQSRLPFKNEYFTYVTGWNSIFTCFYMPAFFVISGYCSNFSKDFRKFLYSLLKNLFLPLMVLSLINNWLWTVATGGGSVITATMEVFKKGGTLWFIQALIVAKLICYALRCVTQRHGIILLFSCLLMVVGIVLNNYKIGDNIFFYQHGFIASFFVAFGHYLKSHDCIYELMLKWSLYCYPLFALFSLYKSPSFTATIGIPLLAIPVFLVLSVSGTLWLLAICKRIEKNSVLEYWGKNSLIVYALHFTPLFLLFKWYYLLLNPENLTSFLIFVILLFGTEYLICYLLIKLFNKAPFTWALGKF